MFEKFTDSARRLVVISQQESRMLGHGHIGTEHLLLGALNVCQESDLPDIDLHQARAVVGEKVPRGTKPPPSQIPFTSEAKQVLERSLRESLAGHHTQVSPWHILLARISDHEYLAVRVLTEMNVDLDDLRLRLRDGMQRDADSSRSAPPEP
jgi:ATP-dependent Clp protease ATP-binding subunit ClpA